MEWMAVAALISGWVGQWIKAHKNVPTIVVNFALLGVGVLFFWISTPLTGPWRPWLMSAVTWGLATIGASTFSATTGMAPKTDTL